MTVDEFGVKKEVEKVKREMRSNGFRFDSALSFTAGGKLFETKLIRLC